MQEVMLPAVWLVWNLNEGVPTFAATPIKGTRLA